MRATLGILGLLAAPAFAADDDGDGWDDAVDDNCPGVPNPDQADANTDGWGDACVAAGAIVHPTVAAGSGLRVGSAASVGAHAVLGARVTLAPKASLAAGASAGQGVTLGDDASLGRRTAVGAGTGLGSRSTVSRAAGFGAGVVGGTDLTIGYAVSVGDGAMLGDEVVLGNLVEIAPGARVGAGAVLGRESRVGPTGRVGVDVRVGPDVQIDGELGDEAVARRGVRVGAGAVVDGQARLGRGVNIGANAQIGEGAALRAGAVVEPWGVVGAGVVVPRDGLVTGGIGLATAGGVRRWADGTRATRCETYRRPSAPYLWQGPDATSGLYEIDPGTGPVVAYCDMVTDGGGWTQISYLSAAEPASAQNGYAAIFSSTARGTLGTGAYKLDASGLLAVASDFRYSEPSGHPSSSNVDSYATDFKCAITTAVRGKWTNPGYMDQAPAAITCVDLHTGLASPRAVNTNYQGWSSGWTGPRLWIGFDPQPSNFYHGDYCVDCVVTWKSGDTGYPGVYSTASADGHNSGSGAFWLR
jgi:UDP-3-O-[3-hydroxymyristoyl] glucosamine N-acyltransferase